MDRLLLILPSATYRAPDFMAAARGLGVAVTVASDRRAAMSAAMGDRALTLRLSDPVRAAEQIAERARDTPFAAIVGVDDQGVMAAAMGAERLGLPHNPPDAVARTRDKAAMRHALAAHEIPQPRFALLADGFWSALLLRLLAGIGWAGTYTPGLKAIADPLEDTAQSRAVSWHAAGVGISGAAPFAIAGLVGNWAGASAAFLLGGATALGTVLIAATVMLSA